MAVLCGWGSQSEHGTVTGSAGDQTQTGREVKTGSWYNFGQTAVYRWKNRTYAHKYASIIKYWCDSKMVGYDQHQRTTLGAWCKRHGWSCYVNTPVETDCSRMVADGINCTLKKEIVPINSTFYTGNLGEVLMKTGLFTKLTGAKYCDTSNYLMVGDIINNPARHVISSLGNGAKIKSGSTTPAKTTSTTQVERVKTGQRGLNSMLGAKLVIDGSRGAQTRKCEIMAVQYGSNKQFRTGLAVDGLFGKATRGALANKYIAKGSHGMYVRAIQCILYTHGYDPKGIDGNFGVGMDAAVRQYQKAHGLTVDGSVGYKTLTSLIG